MAPLQVAVVNRGTCARVAKAIFGQQAGADAVIMVNNADSYPPYEGEITSNPDDGTPYTVTIPFLGVRSSRRSGTGGRQRQAAHHGRRAPGQPHLQGLRLVQLRRPAQLVTAA